jgi:CubicO group peptidase (beta-lactamase class C family)
VWRTRLLDPIGAYSTALFPEEALLHRVAVGHMPDPSGELAVIQRWGWERAGLPEGSSTSITVGDLLRFARLHVDRGRTTDGRALVSEESVDLMHEVAVELPDDFLADAWGLGMSITRRSTAHIVGHSGNWAGHLAILQILPRQRGAIALLTNTTTSTAFLREVLETVLSEVFDIPAAATEKTPVDQPLDVSAFTGRYERGPWQFEVSERDGGLVLAPCILAPEKEQVLEPVAKDQFLMYSSVFDGKFPVTFLQTADGVFLHTTGRAFPQER